MTSADNPRWLNDTEMDTWLNIWSILEWLPNRLDEQLRRDSDLSLTEYNALSQISMAQDSSIRMSELARLANMKLPHLSRVLTRLEKAGWARRVTDPTNGRYTLAELTDAGKDKIAATAPGHVAAVRRYIFDNLSEKQTNDLKAAAALITEAIDPPELMR
ncbi:MarR family transcriptional regulator [Corynebacterium yudongzhengii]|uniref:MarR family transcriptional regulator n=1 Tax=Corynebacterium yudongzhengii TaxID=2080740 RepID=A0A2U1T750_9CORY|nr:MarR family transcriptional regulator [Corynebacterium yudongzhengii]AWB81376.1 MarR family transcriptional regulator [Corynebacterium yudongzhengii]PWC01819.1 MarR family transcriptional regulator [Corynebacterium yudongzhengii]